MPLLSTICGPGVDKTRFGMKVISLLFEIPSNFPLLFIIIANLASERWLCEFSDLKPRAELQKIEFLLSFRGSFVLILMQDASIISLVALFIAYSQSNS
jgi:hypothetical protein